MATIRGRDTETPPMSYDTAAILLGGWGAAPPAGVDRQFGFGGQMLEAFEAGGVARLWREHERFLRATAARWDWAPPYRGPDGVLRYHGEACAWEQARGLGDVHEDVRPDDDDEEEQ
jgi:hypothetical protein